MIPQPMSKIFYHKPTTHKAMKERIIIDRFDLEELIDRVIAHIKSTPTESGADWITPAEAMKLLNLKSQVSLYQLRISGEITYTQPKRKIILYSRESILAYLSKHQKLSFK